MKQYPFFTAIFTGLCLAFLVGVGFALKGGMDYSKNTATLEGSTNILDGVRNNKVAPTRENVDAARSNLVDLQNSERNFFETLRGTQRFSLDSRIEATDLASKLRESRDKLLGDMKRADIRLYGRQGTFGLGFRRYVDATDGNTPRKRLEEIALQKNVIEYLIGTLITAKEGVKNPLILQSVCREPIELSVVRGVGAVAPKTNDDEFIPPPEATLRADNVASTYYFRLVFTARTDVLRRFINHVHGSGYPLALREVKVEPAKAEVLLAPPAQQGAPALAEAGVGNPPPASTPPFPVASPALPGFSGTALPLSGASGAVALDQQPAPVVVRDVPSEFTVSFEYIIPVQPAPRKAANN
ncbi:MAG: Amuc_1100 family pilus-like protein [Puniceicoccales bacterium]|jgi:hypothetical protein|nr:Amuc_1100 family pilus-like protein [Puniceicoccales bacterium]